MASPLLCLTVILRYHVQVNTTVYWRTHPARRSRWTPPRLGGELINNLMCFPAARFFGSWLRILTGVIYWSLEINPPQRHRRAWRSSPPPRSSCRTWCRSITPPRTARTAARELKKNRQDNQMGQTPKHIRNANHIHGRTNLVFFFYLHHLTFPIHLAWAKRSTYFFISPGRTGKV